ncbi:hypothetical protein HID58_020374 [Brassica napus]|uniref:Uncharacterized protein n=1 Tax=Brassica napus TaxID=3708 RepID=A0ABQ7XGP6_BRANA|nr:hypothetical protein HID58_020374 [Brassica napus]
MLSSIGFGLDPEATEILVKQLEQLYTEDKLLREFLPNTDLGCYGHLSSLDPPRGVCSKGKVVDMSSFGNKAKPILEQEPFLISSKKMHIIARTR